jgi:16S rRNA (uracil1498-N3)-methyltransferase
MAHVPRLYLPGPLGPGLLLLDGEQARRLGAVMRVREGDEVRVFAGDGREWGAVVRSAGKGRVELEVGPVERQEGQAALTVEVWCGLVRPNRFDWALEKCTEAGADIIRPLLSAYAARGEGSSAGRQERWQRIVVEASEQSGRLWVPVVEAPGQFEQLLERSRGTVLIGEREGMPWDEAKALLPEQGHVVLAVGPEGGFSPDELSRAKAKGALAVAMSPGILRTETAAVVGTALLRAL